MSYLSLARKYRPNTFADLVGQESVGLALSNAIRLKREPRGVIFTGVRGIGKTTTARIYAKALNCERGPTAEPCNACPSCVAIQQGTHEDVLEIDGASNTGVDDVRALQETLAYVPQRSSFKIYIIDEVHMLSVSAFNALLKTLEEPPEHVVFIFATTELHKVPETIQSRCQVFHLQKISTQLTKKRLESILSAEGIPFEDRAVQWVAREGKGSLRDALTLLDQVIAVGGGTVSWQAVEPMVNTGHAEPIFQLLGHLLSKNSAGLLEAIARWDQEGLAMTTLVEELIKACRNAFVLKSLAKGQAELELLDLEERERETLRGLGASAQLLDLNRLFRSFVKCLDDLRSSEIDRFVVENYALEWCLDPGLPDVASLIQNGASFQKGAPASAPSTHAPSSNAQPATPVATSAASSESSKPAAPSIGLRDRWKQTAGQASSSSPPSSSIPKVETNVTVAIAQAPLGAGAKPQAIKVEQTIASPALPVNPSSPSPSSMVINVKVESSDQNAAKALVNTRSSTQLEDVKTGPVVALKASPVASEKVISPPAEASPKITEPLSSAKSPISQPVSIVEKPKEPLNQVLSPKIPEVEIKRSGASKRDEDLPPWLSSEDDPEFEEFSIIHEMVESSSKKISPSTEEVSLPARKDESKEKLEALLKTETIAPQESSSNEAPVSESWPKTWKEFVDEWKKQKPLQARVLEETFALEYTPGRIKLAVEAESLAGQKLLHVDTRKKLIVQFEALFGFKGLFEVVAKSELQEAAQETLLETKQKIKAKERDDLRHVIENHPLTLQAIAEFDGTIESIEVQ